MRDVGGKRNPANAFKSGEQPVVAVKSKMEELVAASEHFRLQFVFQKQACPGFRRFARAYLGERFAWTLRAFQALTVLVALQTLLLLWLLFRTRPGPAP